MRAILPAIALFAALTTAGSGLAAIEAVGFVSSYVQAQSDATYEYAWDSVDRAAAVGGIAGADLEAKAEAARALAEAAANNAAAQAAETGNLAVSIAANTKETGEAVAAMELAALGQAPDLGDALLACATHPDPVAAALNCQAAAVAWLNAIIAA